MIGVKTLNRVTEICKFTKKIIVDSIEYEWKCDRLQYCRELCKQHYELWSSKDYNVEPYKHSSKEKFYRNIKPLEIKGEE